MSIPAPATIVKRSREEEEAFREGQHAAIDARQAELKARKVEAEVLRQRLAQLDADE